MKIFKNSCTQSGGLVAEQTGDCADGYDIIGCLSRYLSRASASG